MLSYLKQNKIYLLFPLMYFCLCILTPEIYNWEIHWGSQLQQANITTDYPPIFKHILLLYNNIQPLPLLKSSGIREFKFIILLFDFLVAMNVYQILLNEGITKDDALFKTFFLLLNIAFLFNSIVWGEIDAIYTYFVFTSFYFAINQHLRSTLVFGTLSYLANPYTLFFLPILLLLLIKKKYSLVHILSAIALSVATYALVFYTLPSYHISHSLLVKEHIKNNLVDSAYNFWYLFKTKPLSNTHWGLITAIVIYVLALFPLANNTIKNRINGLQALRLPTSYYFLLGSLPAFLIMYFTPHASPKSAYSTLVFIAVYALLEKRYDLYLAFSLIYFINSYDFLRINFLQESSIVPYPTLMAIAYLICLILIIRRIYQDFNLKLKP